MTESVRGLGSSLLLGGLLLLGASCSDRDGAGMSEPFRLNATEGGAATFTWAYYTAIVASGDASGKYGTFTVEIGADVSTALFPSVYKLYVLGVSDQLARVAERAVDLPIGV